MTRDREIARLVRDYREGTKPQPMKMPEVKYYAPGDRVPAEWAFKAIGSGPGRMKRWPTLLRKVRAVLAWSLVILIVIFLIAVSFLAETFRWGFVV